jgi:hypothetical protein
LNSLDNILQAYQRQVALPWMVDAPPAGRIWVVWYDKTLNEDKLSEITSRIPPLAIAPWRWEGSRFFAGQGAFMWTTEHGYMWIGAKTEHPLQFLKPHVDGDWVYVAI